MKLVTVAEMRAIEKDADASGHTYAQMMEHAGVNLAREVDERYGHYVDSFVLGLVGKGNNGGDTLVALAWLAERGWQAGAYLVFPRGEGDPLVERLRAAGGEVLSAKEDKGYGQLKSAIGSAFVVLDGVLGTGVKLPLRGRVKEVLAVTGEHIASLDETPYVVAVDCPSGVDCDTGAVADETLHADVTITMAAVKRGLYAFPAYEYVGELQVVGIGLPESLKAWERVQRWVVDWEMVRGMLPPRPLNAHKGTFGTVLIVAGSVNYTGAVLLAGKAAYRVGAGLVTLAVPSPLHAALAGHFPEATWLLLPSELGVISELAADVVRENLGRVTAMLLGPGFGLEDSTRDFLTLLLIPGPYTKPKGIGFVKPVAGKTSSAQVAELPALVVDADGLKLLAQIENWPEKLPAPAVLTPHPGEMAVLTGLDKNEIQSQRIEVAERFAQTWGHVVVLKGAFTVIAAPDGRSMVVPVATPALARAGTGDVLAGAIAGLRAQGMAAFEAAVAGAWLHAQAGLLAEAAQGNAATVLAGDVLDALVKAFKM